MRRDNDGIGNTRLAPTAPGRLGRRPLFTVGGISLAATAAGLFLPPLAVWLMAALSGALCLFPPLRRGIPALLLTAVFLLSAGVHRGVREFPLGRFVGQQDTVTARVVDTPTDGQMYTVEVTEATRLPAGTRLSLYFAPGSEPLLYDTVTAPVTLEAVPATAVTQRRGQRIFLYAFPAGEWDATPQVVGAAHPPLYILRRYWGRLLRRTLPGEQGALLAALCLGEKRAVSAETTAAFRYSGLSHLLVVSGLHLSLLMVSLRALLRRVGVGYRTASAAVLPLIWVFAGLVGGSPSVLRAAVMGSLWLISFTVYRRYNGLNAWGLAAAVLLAADPYRLLSVSFQLSFAATAGVLLITPRLCSCPVYPDPEQSLLSRLWQGVARYIRDGCAVCIGALLFTLPIATFYFHGVSLTTLLSNLLAVVPAGWALTVGWLGMLLSAVPIIGFVGRPLLYGAGLLADYLAGVARLCGPRAAYAPLPYLWQKLLLGALCAIAATAVLCRVPWRRLLAACLAATVGVCGLMVPVTALTPRLTVIPCGSHGAVLLQQGTHAALLLDHSTALSHVEYDLQERGIRHLDCLYVAEGHSADAATLLRLWEQTDRPPVYTAGDDFAAGLPVAALPQEEPHTLWAGCTLTPVSAGWCRLTLAGAAALVCTDRSAPRPMEEAVTVYTRLPGQLPAVGYCVVACRSTADLSAYTNENALFLQDKSVILTAKKGGEWSVVPWL